MGFQLVQVVYWLALSMWFGGAMFIAVAIRVIRRTVQENHPVLPHVLSVNLEDQHSALLAGDIATNLISALSRIEMACAAILLVTIPVQWFFIDLSDPSAKLSAFLRSGLFLGAVGIVIYDGFFLWPRVLKARKFFVENADDPDKANPAIEHLERLQRDGEMLLMVLVFLLLGMVMFSTAIHHTVLHLVGNG